MKSKFFLALVICTGFVASNSMADEAKKAETKPAAAKAEKKADKAGEKKEEKKGGDADLLKARADELVKALQKSDLDTVMSYFSDDFTSPMIKDKTALKAVLELGSNSGSFSGLTVDNSKSKYEIDGDKATVGPSTFDSSGTTGTATIYAKKKDGSWKISGLDLTGVSF